MEEERKWGKEFWLVVAAVVVIEWISVCHVRTPFKLSSRPGA